MKLKPYLYISLFAGVVSFSSCEKLLEIDPPLNERPSAAIFLSESTAKSALAGAYANLSTTAAFNQDFTVVNALAGGEVAFVGSTAQLDFMQNTYDPVTTTKLNSIWSDIYKNVYLFNSIIEGLNNNVSISAPVVMQMTGEAKTMRAFCYFHLINMFGDVPLVTQTDANINQNIARTPIADIYNYIIKDLEEAKNLVADEYVSNGGIRSRGQVNRSAVCALLARIYLHVGNYTLAAQNASAVIAKTDLYSLLPTQNLADVFLKDSKEAILQLGSAVLVTTGYTVEGSTFIPSTIATVANYELAPSLINAFEVQDKRFSNWILESNLSSKKTYQPFKYRASTSANATALGRFEVPMVLRLSEQYLIRAEARLKLNNTLAALEDVNVIRQRAGLQTITSTNGLEEEILKQRQLEFFCELGDRWYSIKRTGKADAIMRDLRPQTWQSFAKLYPIPQTARDANPLLSQNDGYR